MVNSVPGREAEVRCLGEEVIFDFAQLALAVRFASRFEVPGSDESSDAAPGLNYAKPFKLRVDLGDCVCVDSQVDCELSHSRQLIAYGEFSCRD